MPIDFLRDVFLEPQQALMDSVDVLGELSPHVPADV